MTRARSRADETNEQIAVREMAERERRQGRSKESLAWDLVHKHDIELRHIGSRLVQLETAGGANASALQAIRETQIRNEGDARQILEKLETAELQRAEAAKASAEAAKLADARQLELSKFAFAQRSDRWKNWVALGGMILAALTLLLKYLAP